MNTDAVAFALYSGTIVMGVWAAGVIQGWLLHHWMRTRPRKPEDES